MSLPGEPFRLRDEEDEGRVRVGGPALRRARDTSGGVTPSQLAAFSDLRRRANSLRPTEVEERAVSAAAIAHNVGLVVSRAPVLWSCDFCRNDGLRVNSLQLSDRKTQKVILPVQKFMYGQVSQTEPRLGHPVPRQQIGGDR